MGKAFTDRGIDSPRLCAEILVAHVLGCERLDLYMQADRPASPDELKTLRDLTARALKHEPVQYLTQDAWFFGMELKADQRALIPRPATETLVECAIEFLRGDDAAAGPVLDLCTGSGCVALALAKSLREREIMATDVSTEALELAAENAEKLSLSDRIEFREGSLFEAVGAGATFAAIVSNPPYIPDHEWADVEPNVKDHEPELALRGGADGLEVVRPIVEGAGKHLASGGLLAIEVAASTTDVTAKLFAQHGYERVRVLKDFEGFERVVCGARRV